jgi:hypothetical protein
MSSERRSKRLPSCSPAAGAERDHGVVQHVDTVGREVRLLLSTGAAIVDVPMGCPILLRGERVKLRMLQNGDRVRLTYTRGGGLLLGQLLEVQPKDNCRSLPS